MSKVAIEEIMKGKLKVENYHSGAKFTIEL
jgi:hypothetical protein